VKARLGEVSPSKVSFDKIRLGEVGPGKVRPTEIWPYSPDAPLSIGSRLILPAGAAGRVIDLPW